MWCSAIGCLVTLTLSLLAAPLPGRGAADGRGLADRGSHENPPGVAEVGALPPGAARARVCGRGQEHRLRVAIVGRGAPNGSPTSPPSWCASRSTSS